MADVLTPDASPLRRLNDLLGEDMARVDALILERMKSPVGMIPDLAAHLIDAGGKRLRPMLTVAAARMCGYAGDDHLKLAATVEFIHTATLLHDDVVDGSSLRRGKKPANLVWGNSASVLVGDFLFARSFNLMVETGSLRVLEILSNASSVIAEGEVRQLAAINDVGTSVDTYMEIIAAKTAALFSAATQVGAVIAGRPEIEETALADYGRELGLSFQLVDDALDYGGVEASLGKALGDDFREGKITMPVAIALAEADADERTFWERTIGEHDQNGADFERAVEILRARNAIERTLEAARRHGDAARDALAACPRGDFRDALADLADFVVDRAH
jgi:octaprenyl-diphosphate synthase